MKSYNYFVNKDAVAPPEYSLWTELFRDSFGDVYNGDDSLMRKLTESDVRLGINEHGIVSAGLIAASGRITTIGTRSGKGFAESRSDRLVSLLEIASSIPDISWISAGVQYSRIHRLNEKAGLRRVTVSKTALGLLESIGEEGKYSVDEVKGFPVIHRNGYHQYLYVFPDKAIKQKGGI